MIKLVAIDLDGTLLGADHESVSERMAAALRAAQDAGIRIVISTGRMYGNIPEAVRNACETDYVISSNGAAVWDTHSDTIIYGKPIRYAKAGQVIGLLNREHVYYEMYYQGTSYADRACYDAIDRDLLPDWYEKRIRVHSKPVDNALNFAVVGKRDIEKFNIPFLKEETYRKLWNEIAALGGLEVVSSLGNNIEVNAAGADKGDALLHLCGRLGIDRTEVMAIGDSGNDVQMLHYAGVSIAMGNASPHVKTIAAYVCPSNEEDGVAVVLEDLVKKYRGA